MAVDLHVLSVDTKVLKQWCVLSLKQWCVLSFEIMVRFILLCMAKWMTVYFQQQWFALMPRD